MDLKIGRDQGEAMRSIGALATAGWAFVFALLIGLGGGLFLDRWLGTSPWFFFAGFFLGLAAGVVNLVRASNAASSASHRDRP